ncbi:MAG TPA: tRNA (adenosine(37)-N6)-threonylcarbamoyltransferase complex ATPase subunit type 1 TsaE [Candidatus Faecivivens stercorigallinarum]|nr:tRNA (adenosine(37)-N6)-threonylcarbamoyltransferase complex ATPase subunit type 1 TsaE [Candidatus Faecivivens stercorigallinarum]
MMKFVSHSEAETEAIGEKFARMLHPGDVVAFTGGLGAGKTAFTRGMARTLAPDAEVSSPTFALVNDYGGKVPFWHFDMYRIRTMDDLYSTGFFDYLESGGILAVEWSENIAGALPDGTIYVRITADGENERTILIGNDPAGEKEGKKG